MVDSGSAIANVLAAGGVQRMYTVPGESFLEILDGVQRHPDLNLVSTRHESGAAFMAEADAKITGRPAVVGATRGVGGANLTIGVHTAYQDSTPMLAFLGQVDSAFLGRESFQEVDLPAFFAPITKSAVTAHRSDRIPELVAEALRIATTGRPGPVVIAFPADVLAEAIEDSAVADAQRRLAMQAGPPAASPSDIAQIAAKLASAERPVIIAGGGARGARRELRAVAERYSAGVYVSFRRQDTFDNRHPQFLGHIGLGTDRRCLDALRDADFVLVAGTRLSEITTSSYTLPARSSEVCQIDVDASVIGAVVPVSIGLVSDVRTALQALLDRPEADTARQRDWSSARKPWERAAVIPPSRATRNCDPAQVIAAMAEVFPIDSIITNDAGNFSAFLHRHWQFSSPRSQIGPTHGAMGYGVPGAIGAKFAAPDRTVVGLAGDGGFLMSGQEVETAVRYGLDVTLVVFRNGLHGTIAMHQARDVGRLTGVDIGAVDVAGFARSLGANAVTVETEADLIPALKEAYEGRGPQVVDVIVDSEIISPDLRLSQLLAAHHEEDQ